MSREHAGGVIPDGLFRVPVEWSQDQARAVPITSFDPASIDTLTDLCREAILDGKPIEPIIQQFVRIKRKEWMSDGCATVLAEVIGCKHPSRALWAWAYAVGLYATEGKSGPEIAKQFGVRKQAFAQQVDRIRERLGGRILRLNMRSQESRDRMARRNYRHQEGNSK